MDVLLGHYPTYIQRERKLTLSIRKIFSDLVELIHLPLFFLIFLDLLFQIFGGVEFTFPFFFFRIFDFFCQKQQPWWGISNQGEKEKNANHRSSSRLTPLPESCPVTTCINVMGYPVGCCPNPFCRRFWRMCCQVPSSFLSQFFHFYFFLLFFLDSLF